MSSELSWWIGFNLFVLLMLALDLGVFHKHSHVVKMKEALTWSGVWIGLALIFNLGIYLGWLGPYTAAERPQMALEFLTAYLLEKSLSIDNVFVIALLFGYFAVPEKYQHRVLFWGVLGALVMRAILIFAGISLLERFHWIIYVFGAILIVSGVKMLLHQDKAVDPSKNPILRLVKRIIPVSDHYHGQAFFIRENGVRLATPLFVVLILIEWTDLVFAVDSIPAVLAVSKHPFIVYTSNVFAILGLRSLYFALAGLLPLFRFLNYGLAAILIFVGGKMLLLEFYKVPTALSLGVVGSILLVSVLASLLLPAQAKPTPSPVS
jgi:tellurite resistance protein TerC